MMTGRKVYFLYPNQMVKDLIKEIIRYEYEIYIIDNHLALKKLLRLNKNAIVFINIEERLKEEEWELYIKDILSNPDTKETGIGILTYFDRNQALTEKYLLEMGITCGYIRLKTSIEKCRDIILRTLDANEARGRRRFVRGMCNSRIDTFNLYHGGSRYNGKILDISIAGFACYFEDVPPKVEVGLLLKDIQLILRGIRCKVDGHVIRIDHRQNDYDVYIIIFDQGTIIPAVRNKIHDFIFLCFQSMLEQEIKQLS
ncbi:MAG: PilZ domain-containing protein [Spirochaetales bacterium]|nr:PilZ domain-containing protein [Spirochaetales bacterium]